MIVEFALAVGALAPFPDPKVEPIPAPDDCVKAQPIKPPATKPHKAVVVKHRRLFKADPKPVAEPCESTLPPFTFLPPEPADGFTPIPEIAIVPFDLPVPGVPPVEAGPCGCDWPGGGVAYFVGGGFGSGGYSSPPASPGPGTIAPVPEPIPALLILAGLGTLGFRRLAVSTVPSKRGVIQLRTWLSDGADT